MGSNYETFFDNQVFAVIGHSKERPFPLLTLGGLKKKGKTVFAIDASANTIGDEQAYDDLTALPQIPDAAVLEVPRAETRAWVERVAEAGIKDVWLHRGTDTPEALALAGEKGLNVRTGTCAVQYVDSSFPHGVHKLIRKIMKRW